MNSNHIIIKSPSGVLTNNISDGQVNPSSPKNMNSIDAVDHQILPSMYYQTYSTASLKSTLVASQQTQLSEKDTNVQWYYNSTLQKEDYPLSANIVVTPVIRQSIQPMTKSDKEKYTQKMKILQQRERLVKHFKISQNFMLTSPKNYMR